MKAKLSDEAFISIVEQHGLRGAPKYTGSNLRNVVARRRRLESKLGISITCPEDHPKSEIEFPELPSSELPPDQLIDQACARFTGHKAAREARRWMEIKIKGNQPIGVCFMGDPHIDNNGCNWPLLKRDIAILKDTPGMYAINLGDATDNWIGRLVRLYADQEVV